MIQLTPHAEGFVLAVRAQPGAKKNAITGQLADAVKISVTAPPEDGRANVAIIDLLRSQLKCKRAEVELLTGQTNRNKSILIRGLTSEEIIQRLGLD